MTFDPKCYDLALLFLSDEPQLDVEVKRRELAALIQATIEDYLEQERQEAVDIEQKTAAAVRALRMLGARP